MPYYDTNEAAADLSERGCKIAPQTLRKLRCIGGGPPYQKNGQLAVYAVANLDAYAEARLGPLRHSTSTEVGA